MKKVMILVCIALGAGNACGFDHGPIRKKVPSVLQCMWLRVGAALGSLIKKILPKDNETAAEQDERLQDLLKNYKGPSKNK